MRLFDVAPRQHQSIAAVGLPRERPIALGDDARVFVLFRFLDHEFVGMQGDAVQIIERVVIVAKRHDASLCGDHRAHGFGNRKIVGAGEGDALEELIEARQQPLLQGRGQSMPQPYVLLEDPGSRAWQQR